MRFAFDEEKTTQAASHLLKKFGGRHNLMVLLKLLYFADRRSLVETGHPITGDRMGSMRYGPVLSGTYALVNEGPPPGDSPWYKAIGARNGYEVSLTRDPGSSALSEYEISLLDELFLQYGHLDQWKLSEISHTFPEWTDPGRSFLPIDPATILESAGFSSEEIQRVTEEAEEEYAFRAFRAVQSESDCA